MAEGSTGESCDVVTGQCTCNIGTAIIGRICDTCSPGTLGKLYNYTSVSLSFKKVCAYVLFIKVITCAIHWMTLIWWKWLIIT